MWGLHLIHPDSFTFARKLEWSVFALFCTLFGLWLVLRGIFIFDPEKVGFGPGLRRLWNDGLDSKTPTMILMFGIVLTMWSIMITFAVVLPAWGAK